MARPLSIILPDRLKICETVLRAEGFNEYKSLAVKLYNLNKVFQHSMNLQDLSNYDSRKLLILLKLAGKKKRLLGETVDENQIIAAAIEESAFLRIGDYESIIPIMEHLFPNTQKLKLNNKDISQSLIDTIKEECMNLKLKTNVVFPKVLEFYELKKLHHTVITVGAAGSGKSTIWKILKTSLCKLAKMSCENFKMVEIIPINPSLYDEAEIFGDYNYKTSECYEGIFSTLMARVSLDAENEHWFVLDGPINTLYAENLNFYMEPRHHFTVGNKRIKPLTIHNVSYIFEIEDLSDISPSFITRIGVIFNDFNTFGIDEVMNQWLRLQPNKCYRSYLKQLMEKYYEIFLEQKNKYCCDIINIPESVKIRSLCNMLSAFIPPEKVNTLDTINDNEKFQKLIKLYFLFCLIWYFGALLDIKDRHKFDRIVKNYTYLNLWPPEDTVFDCYVHEESLRFYHFSYMLKSIAAIQEFPEPFFTNVPYSAEICCYMYICCGLIDKGKLVLLIDSQGLGRTYVLDSVRLILKKTEFTFSRLNLTAKTSVKFIESFIKCKTNELVEGYISTPAGKRFILLLDDFNAPEKNEDGTQPIHEFIRHWDEYGVWFDRKNKNELHFKDNLVIAAMGFDNKTGTPINHRVLSHFNVFNITCFKSLIKAIFLKHIEHHPMENFMAVHSIYTRIVKLTWKLFDNISKLFIPKPSKMHYIFRYKDLLTVLENFLNIYPLTLSDARGLDIQIWIQEILNIFHNIDISERDEELLLKLIRETVETEDHIVGWNELYNPDLIYCNYMNDDLEYEQVTFDHIKNFFYKKVKEFNEQDGIAFFDEAIMSLFRIIKILQEPFNNLILIGLDGSTRKILAKLAIFILKFETVECQVVENTTNDSYVNYLKQLYTLAGINQNSTALILTNILFKDELFLEILSNLFGSGEISYTNSSKLFTTEELFNMSLVLGREEVLEQNWEELHYCIIDRYRRAIRIVVCLDPQDKLFRSYFQNYPCLHDRCNILWLPDWPKEATFKIANFLVKKFVSVKEVKKDKCEMQANLCDLFGRIHYTIENYPNRKHRVSYLDIVNCISTYHQEGEKQKKIIEKREELFETIDSIKNIFYQFQDSQILMNEKKNNIDEFNVHYMEYVEKTRLQNIALANLREQTHQLGSKIIEGKENCEKMAGNIMAELTEQANDIEDAIRGMDLLSKRDIIDIRKDDDPPEEVKIVMFAILVIKQLPPTWPDVQLFLKDNIKKKLLEVEPDKLPMDVVDMLSIHTSNPEFDPDHIAVVSNTAKVLANWVLAIDNYVKKMKLLQPKKDQLEETYKWVAMKEEEYALEKQKISRMEELVADMEDTSKKMKLQKNELVEKIKEFKKKIDESLTLIAILNGLFTYVCGVVSNLNSAIEFLFGDSLIAAACITYLGPYNVTEREYFLNIWKKFIRQADIKFSKNYNMSKFLISELSIGEWAYNGLASNLHMIENATITMKAILWPLIIDPQTQAFKWIKAQEEKNGLRIVNYGEKDFITKIKIFMENGSPIILQNVGECIDPRLIFFLNKGPIMRGNKIEITIGDGNTAFDDNTRLYIITKLNKPEFPTFITSKVALINFSFDEEALEAYLLEILMDMKQPNYKKKKFEKLETITKLKSYLSTLTEDILTRVYDLDDDILNKINIHVHDENYDKIQGISELKLLMNKLELLLRKYNESFSNNSVDEVYKPCTKLAAKIYFIWNDLQLVNPLYKFSFDQFLNVFVNTVNTTLAKHHYYPSNDHETEINLFNDQMLMAAYRDASLAMFYMDKLLLSFLLFIRIFNEDSIPTSELDFLMSGSDKDISEVEKNLFSDWLPDKKWINLVEFMLVTGKCSVLLSMQSNTNKWKIWYFCDKPEYRKLDDYFENTYNSFQRVLLIRALRNDRLSFAMNKFLTDIMDKYFVEPLESDNIENIINKINNRIPILFIEKTELLASEQNLVQLADDMKISLFVIDFSPGNVDKIDSFIKKAKKCGYWIFLRNINKFTAMRPYLYKLIDNLQNDNNNIHENFCLWLSAITNNKIPDFVLESCIKITNEEPISTENVVNHLIDKFVIEEVDDLSKMPNDEFLRAITIYHSLLTRREELVDFPWHDCCKFLTSDLQYTLQIISDTIFENPNILWQNLKYLISNICYGGLTLNEWDLRTVTTHLDDIFDGKLIKKINTAGLITGSIIQPEYSRTKANIFLEICTHHMNKYLSINNEISLLFCNNLLKIKFGGTEPVDTIKYKDKIQVVLTIAIDILSKIDDLCVIGSNSEVHESIKNKKSLIQTSEVAQLNVTISKEIAQYNRLLDTINNTVEEVIKCLTGATHLTSELEEICELFYTNKVPHKWNCYYFSSKSLGDWINDFILRVEYFNQLDFYLNECWLSAFMYPTRFLIAILQGAAKMKNVFFNQITWEYQCENKFEEIKFADKTLKQEDVLYDISSSEERMDLIKEGIVVHGMYVHGAEWDAENSCLKEPSLFHSTSPLPDIRFKPILVTEKENNDLYQCPLLYDSARDEIPHNKNFITVIELETGSVSNNHWIKHGTVALLNVTNKE